MRLTMDNKTYYYYTEQQYALDILKNHEIKHSRINKVNDTHEFLGIKFDTFYIADMYYPSELIKSLFERHLQRQSQKLTFLCLSGNWNSPIMWGHYSSNATGICLGFELTIPKEEIHKVEYSKSLEKLSIPTEILQDIIQGKNTDRGQKFFIQTLTYKSMYWSYEDEYKIFHYNDSDLKVRIKGDGEKLYFSDLSPDILIKEIFIGCKSNLTPIDICCLLKEYKFPYNVEIFKVKNSDTLFTVEKDNFYDKVTYYS